MVLCSTTHQRVQFVLGIHQGGNLFTVVEMEIHYQYTQAVNRISSPCQFQVFSTYYLLLCNLAVVKVLFP